MKLASVGFGNSIQNIQNNKLQNLDLRRSYDKVDCDTVNFSRIKNDAENLSFKGNNKNPDKDLINYFREIEYGKLDPKNHEKMIKLLLKKGADINARDDYGQSLLHKKAYNREITELLIKNGADVNARDKDGKTPLHCANSETVDLLIEKGADVQARDNNGVTPLHCAESKKTAETLVENGADVNAKSKAGLTPLFRAVMRNSMYVPTEELVEFLLEKGADPNVKDEDGNTPLHKSVEDVEAQSIEITKALVKNGANVNARDKDGRTPLHRVWTLEEAGLLINHGGNVYIKDKNGKTPYQRAINACNYELANFLGMRTITAIPDVIKRFFTWTLRD
ncbi:MAG: hypothetical protein A2104_02905 [Candidatus Melainabacteria bacterium GWF2_32_7]|nr:MAG: hypothetical protein A2104_02905 [Candidatus Melainabacteria bacterium GWF2_32_7]